MMYGCAECGKEITHDNLLLVERMLIDEDDINSETALCVTHTHPCTTPFIIAMYPIDKIALRRLFPEQETVKLPWPASVHMQEGILIDGTKPYRVAPTVSPNKALLQRSIWELEQTEGAWDALLFMRGQRQPEEYIIEESSDDT